MLRNPVISLCSFLYVQVIILKGFRCLVWEETFPAETLVEADGDTEIESLWQSGVGHAVSCSGAIGVLPLFPNPLSSYPVSFLPFTPFSQIP